MEIFSEEELKKLQKRQEKPENGQVTIIGGSDLFHGAPILALKVASKVVDMVYFSSPEPSVGEVANKIKSQLSSFIWVPWSDIGRYVEKSDSVLIGPGMKRWGSERKIGSGGRTKVFDSVGEQTRRIVERFLVSFPEKHWVIDGGALQVMNPSWIPKGSIVTPNKKEFEMLFAQKTTFEAAKKYQCTVVAKGPKTIVCDSKKCLEVEGGNNGLTKGGTGDTLAGLTVALFAQNNAFLAACTASWVVKRAADNLLKKVGTVYNADDLADAIPQVLREYLGS